MKRRWSSNTWILLALTAILVVIGVDVGRRALSQASAVDPAAARAAMEPSFKVGDRAPDFTLPDAGGVKRTFSKLVKGDTLLNFSCGCNNCRNIQSYLGELTPKMGAKAPAVITVATSPPEAEKAWIRDTRLKQTVLYDGPEKTVGGLYQGHPCPRVFRIKPDRTVAWIGPSPASMGAMAPMMMIPMAYAIAGELGFDEPGGLKQPGKPAAPVAKFPNTPPPVSAFNPPSAPAAPQHGPGDGHGH
jgi:hypothetical protein